jgi:hypothetical protein
MFWFGEASTLCYDLCTQTDPCRTGYACYDVGLGTTGACLLDPIPTAPQPPDSLVGSPCTVDSQCQVDGGYPAGFCYPQTLSGAATGFTGGYCMGDCTAVENCGNTAICLSTSTFSFCADLCSAPKAGQSDCRANYVCEAWLIGLPDGGTTESTDGGYCFPNCNAAGAGWCGTGFTCTATGYCQ